MAHERGQIAHAVLADLLVQRNDQYSVNLPRQRRQPDEVNLSSARCCFVLFSVTGDLQAWASCTLKSGRPNSVVQRKLILDELDPKYSLRVNML